MSGAANTQAARYAEGVDAEPYRIAPPPRPDPYLVAWASLRRFRRTMVGVSIGIVHIAAATFAFIVWSRSCTARIVGIGVVLLVAAVWRIAFSMPGLFRCPRCRRGFFRSDAGLFGLAVEHCQHCGIPVGTPAPTP
jgi:hypothetical protein